MTVALLIYACGERERERVRRIVIVSTNRHSATDSRAVRFGFDRACQSRYLHTRIGIHVVLDTAADLLIARCGGATSQATLSVDGPNRKAAWPKEGGGVGGGGGRSIDGESYRKHCLQTQDLVVL